MKTISRFFFIYITLKFFFKYRKDFLFNDLNFKKLDFTNHKQIKLSEALDK